MRLFTQKDIAEIFNISNTALTELVSAGKIPYKIIEGEIRFCPDAINNWSYKPELGMDDKKYLERYKKRLWEKTPKTMQAIQEYGAQYSDPRDIKRFYLDPVPNKKLGFVYSKLS